MVFSPFEFTIHSSSVAAGFTSCSFEHSLSQNYLTMTNIVDSRCNMIAKALLLNNEGVACLRIGNPQRAIVNLKQSLHMFDESLRSNQSDRQMCSQIDFNDMCSLSSVPFLGKLDGNDFHLFDSAITLTRPPTEPNAASSLAFYTASAMLNLALGYHQFGQMAKLSASKLDQTRSGAILEKADRLYQAVLHVMDVSSQQDASLGGIFRFYSLAAQNNRLGIALAVSAAGGATSQLKATLDQMMNCISDLGCSNLGYEYLNEFFLNSTLLEMTSMFTTLPAPCA